MPRTRDEDTEFFMEAGTFDADYELKWPCPECGCSHELEKGLHERWGCYLDTEDFDLSDEQEVDQWA